MAKSILKFAVIGVLNTIFGLIVIYTLMYSWELNFVLSNIIGYAFGILLSFILNSIWTFNLKLPRSADELKLYISKFLTFSSLNIIVYLSSLVVLYLIVEVLNVNKYISQLISVLYNSIAVYFLARMIFKPTVLQRRRNE